MSVPCLSLSVPSSLFWKGLSDSPSLVEMHTCCGWSSQTLKLGRRWVPGSRYLPVGLSLPMRNRGCYEHPGHPLALSSLSDTLGQQALVILSS